MRKADGRIAEMCSQDGRTTNPPRHLDLPIPQALNHLDAIVVRASKHLDAIVVRASNHLDAIVVRASSLHITTTRPAARAGGL